MSEASEERRLWGEVDPRWRRRFGVVAEAAGLVVLVGASLALVGRVLSVPILAQWIPELTVRPMQPATAFLFMMGGLSLLGALVSTGRWTRVLGILAAAVVLAGGISVIVANVANLRFPRWLLSSLTAEDVVGGELPARPALNEGAVLAACGAALILLATRSRIAHIFGQVLAVAAAMVGATVIVAFAYGDDTLRGFPLGSGRMAISAALLTVVFCAGIVIARPGLGIMAPIISPWPGGGSCCVGCCPSSSPDLRWRSPGSSAPPPLPNSRALSPLPPSSPAVFWRPLSSPLRRRCPRRRGGWRSPRIWPIGRRRR